MFVSALLRRQPDQRSLDPVRSSLRLEKVSPAELREHSNAWLLSIFRNIHNIAAFIGYENIENIDQLEPYGLESAEYIYFQP